MDDKTREELLKIYDEVGYFSEGLAKAKKDGLCFHIYPDGAPAYKERYFWVACFWEGLACAMDKKGCLHIDYDGKPVYSERYTHTNPFLRGRSLVRGNDGKWFYIDRNGQVVISRLFKYST